MKRQIIHIDSERCTGCGLCVDACHEGALKMVNGKAKLVSESYCDGLGACLPACPADAIRIETREAAAFDATAVAATQAAPKPHHPPQVVAGGCACPGSKMLDLRKQAPADAAPGASGPVESQLRQWPIQLHLINPLAPYYQGADVLLTADCVAYALGNYHGQYLKNKALAIACPKLDENQDVYAEKIRAWIDDAKINTLTVMIMEVPCCHGLLALAQQAAAQAKRKVPVKKIVVRREGGILEEAWA